MDERAQLLEKLRQRGLEIRDGYLPAQNGFMVTDPSTFESVTLVSDVGFVQVYEVDDGWECRVTQHGGPHWIHAANSLAEIEAIVAEFFSDPQRPPKGDGWIVDE